MSKINDGGPAFPRPASQFKLNQSTHQAFPYNGMTLRDWFAGQALAGFIDFGTKSDDEYFELGARAAYLMADAMLRAREVKP
jgi:hypothetical protein